MKDSRSPRGDPSIHQLRLFLILAEELHFRNAANRAYMSQPAFSQQIRDLEERLDVRLFDRTTRTVTLTDAGRTLLPAATTAVDAVADVRRLAGGTGSRISGRVVIGCIASEAHQPYAGAIVRLMAVSHPDSRVEFRNLDFAAQFNAVSDGHVDAALLRPPIPAGLEELVLATEPRVACLAADDPLVRGGGVSVCRVTELNDRTFADVPSEVDRDWWDYWSVNPRPDGCLVTYGPMASDIESLLQLVARGDAIAMFPSAARDRYPRPGIAYLEVTDLPLCAASLVWAQKRRDSPVVSAIRQAAWKWKLASGG